jgi:hypothetical protein
MFVLVNKIFCIELVGMFMVDLHVKVHIPSYSGFKFFKYLL